MRLLGQPPASPGMTLSEVDTPALIVELAALDRNIRRLPAAIAKAPVRIRPHAKSHKCPQIARLQIAAGAVGVCCQKVSEAEALVAGGISDIFVSNEIVGVRKLQALAELAARAQVSVCADDAGNVSDIAAAADRAGSTLTLFVEIDVGSRRCGVPPGSAAVDLARCILSYPRLRFGGLQAYHGPAQHVRDVAQRRAAATAAAESARLTKELLLSNGIECAVITGGGTGTFEFDAASGVYDEIQPGSYVFMDADYARNEWAGGEPDFQQSLFVWTTVMSRPDRSIGSVDAGIKSLSNDSGPPQVRGRPDIEYVRGADEHGVLRFNLAERAPRLGEKLMLVPGHCDPTVNLHDWIVGVRDGIVEAVWPVAARGAIH
ncbi:MAG: DSD1 family PLP-dependent enzyme [Opitutaceae bacterium]|nr:DSD1 family PLP-dependent enzyme [Opitutaceae bacterium]